MDPLRSGLHLDGQKHVGRELGVDPHFVHFGQQQIVGRKFGLELRVGDGDAEERKRQTHLRKNAEVNAP